MRFSFAFRIVKSKDFDLVVAEALHSDHRMATNHYLLSHSDWEWCLKENVRVSTPECSDYPRAFLELAYRPGVLYYLGRPVWTQMRTLSVVGSRSPQPMSLAWLDHHLTDFLKNQTVATVSGGARGIDQKVHQISLRSQVPTVAFLPSGLRQVFPADFSRWMNAIISGGGCIVSPFPPSMPMQRRFFRQRNVLIAAMSEVTLVVECKRRSGTMITAQNCLQLNKRLAVVPTFPSDIGRGGLDLICDDMATPVRDANDLQSVFGEVFDLETGVS